MGIHGYGYPRVIDPRVLVSTGMGIHGCWCPRVVRVRRNSSAVGARKPCGHQECKDGLARPSFLIAHKAEYAARRPDDPRGRNAAGGVRWAPCGPEDEFRTRAPGK